MFEPLSGHESGEFFFAAWFGMADEPGGLGGIDGQGVEVRG